MAGSPLMEKALDVKFYNTKEKNLPTVYSIQYVPQGKELFAKCMDLGAPPFTLICISGLPWDEWLSPWKADRVFSKEDNFTGEGEMFLQLLTRDMIPDMEAQLELKPPTRIISGYSMAGLFALWASTKCDLFNGTVSASGSLWFPEFESYALENPLSHKVRCAYLSLGDKESEGKNPVLKTTEGITRKLCSHYNFLGVESTFESNPGNHFKDTLEREAKGIVWALSKLSGKK